MNVRRLLSLPLLAISAAVFAPFGCGGDAPPVATAPAAANATATAPAASTSSATADNGDGFDLAALEKKWPSKNKVIREKRPDGSVFVSMAKVPLSRYDLRDSKEFAAGDWMVDNLGGQPSVITPYIEKENSGSLIQGNVLEALLTRDPDTFEWLPFLAESYEQKADKVTFVFVLRKEATWSDGKPVTADDVVFSFNTVMGKDIDDDRYKSYYAQVKSVRKIDDRTVEWTFTEPYFQALEQAGSLQIVPQHVYAYKDADEFNHRNDLLVGSGPYTFEKSQWQRGQQLTLTRNANYWGPKPPYDRIVYKFITNPTAAFQAFQNGEIDQFTPQPDQYDKYSKDADFSSKYQLFAYYIPNNGYRYIGWNEKKPMFADKETRQALTMLIDRKTIIDSVVFGMARETTGPFSPMTPQCDQTIKPWPFDPKAARKKLAEAGWKLNDNNVLVRNGVEFRFDMTIPTDAPVYEKTCELMVNQLAKAGIIMRITPYQWSVMVDRMDDRNYDASMVGWTGGIEEDPYQIWHSSQIAGKGSNYISWSNKDADQLIETGRREMDESKRMEIWHKLHHIIHEEQPYTFLTFQNDRIFVQSRFKNVIPTRTGMNSFDWYVPTALQKYH